MHFSYQFLNKAAIFISLWMRGVASCTGSMVVPSLFSKSLDAVMRDFFWFERSLLYLPPLIKSKIVQRMCKRALITDHNAQLVSGGELRLIIIIIANYEGLRLLVIISNFWSNTVITWFTLFLPVMAGAWDRNLELHSLCVYYDKAKSTFYGFDLGPS